MRALFGGILLAIGILIAGASGLCSLGVGITMISQAMHGPGGFQAFLSSIWLVGLVGGIPFSIGFGLIYAGRALIRKDRDE